jgi:phage shock protein PspC (stress-responsive transcriptional regulator)
MKKIITINLSGQILPIEEPAFEQLQAYIATLRQFFAGEEGRDEIINDMEGRIAELMHKKIKKGSPCITEADVQELIGQMGSPEALAQEGLTEEKIQTESGSSASKESTARKATPERKLYRDSNNKVIGGVASGLAAYLGIDPTIVRALCVVLAFSSGGLILLAYILMWISLPADRVETYQGKRFYRDPDNKVLGGVAAGLGAYFDKPAKTIRLIFLSPLLLQIVFAILTGGNADFTFVLFNISVGSLIFFSAILYITLWIILPKAITPYQKMEMRGEKIDLASIQHQVRQGAGQLKEKLTNWSKEVEAAANDLPGKATDFANQFSQRVTDKVSEKAPTLAGRILSAIGLLAKIFFAFIFGIIAFVLLILLLTVFVVGIVTWPYQNFLWANSSQQLLACAALVLFVLVPLFGFIIWLIRRILGYKKRSAALRYSFFSLWTLGWIIVFLFLSSIGKEFSTQEQAATSVPIAVAAPSSLHLTVSQPTLYYSNKIPWIHVQGEEKGWDLTGDSLKLSAVVIETTVSPDSGFRLELIRSATGRNKEQALHRAEALDYAVNANNYFLTGPNKADTTVVVDLPSYFAIAAKDKYRAQQVKLVVQIPVGKTISFDESIKEKLTIGELHVHYSKGRWREVKWDNAAFPYEYGVVYKMMPDGTLRPISDTALPDPL